MLKIFLLSAALVVAIVAALAFTVDSGSDDGILLVQRAEAGRITPGSEGRFTLVMEDTRHVTWFSNRPERSAGTMEPGEFVELLQSDDFADDPPNAALEAGGVVFPMEVFSVSLDAATGTLTYEVAPLDESEVETTFQVDALREIEFAPATLFIDSATQTRVNDQITD